MARRQLGREHGRLRRGKIDHNVGRGEQGRRIVTGLDADRADAREFAQIAAQCGIARGVDARHDTAARRRRRLRHQHAPHSPGAARDADP